MKIIFLLTFCEESSKTFGNLKMVDKRYVDIDKDFPAQLF